MVSMFCFAPNLDVTDFENKLHVSWFSSRGETRWRALRVTQCETSRIGSFLDVFLQFSCCFLELFLDELFLQLFGVSWKVFEFCFETAENLIWIVIDAEGL